MFGYLAQHVNMVCGLRSIQNAEIGYRHEYESLPAGIRDEPGLVVNENDYDEPPDEPEPPPRKILVHKPGVAGGKGGHMARKPK